MSFSTERKPHAVLTPFPLQGHINPLGPNSLVGLVYFCFDSIPDGLPHNDDNLDVTQHVVSICESIREKFLLPFRDLLARLNHSATAGLVPPVTCLISDCAMTFTIQAAKELALPILLFHPASASTLLSGLHFSTLLNKGLIPLKDENYLTDGYLDTKVDLIPAADQPTNCRYICNEWDIGVEIDTNVKREEVEKQVNELMVGDKAKRMRQKVMELKKKAEENIKVRGYSYMNLDKVINEVMYKQV
uniref:Cytokinin-O-glucosyltransferase 2 n=1 Tax=Cajanus cajan TaxID=3821 RepID=A0A151RZW2_CAJCA|nr:Cytokinin-O-glucosyltransferase 2 [Cajanus cajan]